MATVEELMVQEYLDLKAQVKTMEKELEGCKKLIGSLNIEKEALLTLIGTGYSAPNVNRDEQQNVTRIYVSGGSIYLADNNAKFSQAVMNKLGKDIETKYNNKGEN